jgi:SAM-dependent methyltransferase
MLHELLGLPARGPRARGARPLSAGGRWEDAGVVGGFATAEPNPVLVEFARSELARGTQRVLDLGCGAGRNARPIAALGADVVGIDLAAPMLDGARRRLAAEGLAGRVSLVRGRMDQLPLAGGCVDLVVAHGVWNLARSDAELRRAIAEAARVARPGAGLFLFTFSRATLAPEAQPLPGESYAFTQFAGEPQCFLTEEQVLDELLRAGFEDPPGPLTERNLPLPRALTRSGPVVLEGTFRRR